MRAGEESDDMATTISRLLHCGQQVHLQPFSRPFTESARRGDTLSHGSQQPAAGMMLLLPCRHRGGSAMATGTALLKRRHPNRRFIGWLALLALLLLNVAPTVSRLRSTAWVVPDLGVWCGSHAAGNSAAHAGYPAPHRGSLDHCGYCGLVRHAPPLPDTGLAWVLLPLLPQQVPGLTGGSSLGSSSRLAALPRGPPVRELVPPYLS